MPPFFPKIDPAVIANATKAAANAGENAARTARLHNVSVDPAVIANATKAAANAGENAARTARVNAGVNDPVKKPTTDLSGNVKSASAVAEDHTKTSQH